MTENEKALRRVELFMDNSIANADRIFKEAAIDIFSRVVDQTPTFFPHEPTSGNTKSNWNISHGHPDTSYNENSADFAGDQTKSDIRNVVNQTRLSGQTTFYLTNSSPSMPSLELGLYPNPPMLGSWNTLTQTYEIRSRGGYSLQAPRGIVGVTAMQWQDVIADAVAKHSRG